MNPEETKITCMICVSNTREANMKFTAEIDLATNRVSYMLHCHYYSPKVKPCDYKATLYDYRKAKALYDAWASGNESEAAHA